MIGGATLVHQWTNSDQANISVSGNCNAFGDHSTACTIANPLEHIKLASASIGPLPDAKQFIYLGAASALPTPPDYPKEDWTSHCDYWSDWLEEMGLYSVAPSLMVDAHTGPNESLSIKDVRVKVFTKTQIDWAEATGISCGWGAGTLVPGSSISVDTITQKTVAAQGSNSNLMEARTPMPMPPARINLTSSDGETALIDITGDPDYAYAGSVTIDLEVNGNPMTRTLGSPTHPYRWIPQARDGRSRLPIQWGWNPMTHEWTQDLASELGQSK